MAGREDQDENRKTGFAYAAGITLFASVIVLGLGWLLDRWLATAPWLLIAGVVLGAVVVSISSSASLQSSSKRADLVAMALSRRGGDAKTETPSKI